MRIVIKRDGILRCHHNNPGGLAWSALPCGARIRCFLEQREHAKSNVWRSNSILCRGSLSGQRSYAPPPLSCARRACRSYWCSTTAGRGVHYHSPTVQILAPPAVIMRNFWPGNRSLALQMRQREVHVGVQGRKITHLRCAALHFSSACMNTPGGSSARQEWRAGDLSLVRAL